MIFRLSHVTQTPMKDVCEFLALYVLDDVPSIKALSKYFKRSVWIDGVLHTGVLNAPTIKKRLNVDADLVTIKFKAIGYERIATIAYALDLTPTRTTAVLLEIASSDVKAVNEYVYLNLKSELHEWQLSELRKILTYANRFNEHHSSWLSILSKIVGDVRPATRKLKELVNEFLNK